MNRYKYFTAVLSATVYLALTSCSNYAADNLPANKIIVNSSSADSLSKQKEELTTIYTQAIAEFINAAYRKDKTGFDTLFFGKHVYGQADDFPDIALPETIANTPVRIITPEDGVKKQQERKSLVYVNMMGWVEKEKAQFVFVVFSNGAEHQYDYTIDFSYSSTRKVFELEEILFENYLKSKGERPKRITIYRHGNYIEYK